MLDIAYGHYESRASKTQAPQTASQCSLPRYVIQLSDEVWNYAKFRRCNPDYELGKPFVYVGMTGLDPDVRFDKHKAGIQANSYVQNYGLHLLPQLYEKYNPMGYQEAKGMEVELGIALRARGFGVWQA